MEILSMFAHSYAVPIQVYYFHEMKVDGDY